MAGLLHRPRRFRVTSPAPAVRHVEDYAAGAARRRRRGWRSPAAVTSWCPGRLLAAGALNRNSAWRQHQRPGRTPGPEMTSGMGGAGGRATGDPPVLTNWCRSAWRPMARRGDGSHYQPAGNLSGACTPEAPDFPTHPIRTTLRGMLELKRASVRRRPPRLNTQWAGLNASTSGLGWNRESSRWPRTPVTVGRYVDLADRGAVERAGGQAEQRQRTRTAGPAGSAWLTDLYPGGWTTARPTPLFRRRPPVADEPGWSTAGGQGCRQQRSAASVTIVTGRP